MSQLILIAHNLRSAHNVGSLLRTADGLGVEQVFLTGYTPYPQAENDTRLPHLAEKAEREIAKTALGAEQTVAWHRREALEALLPELKQSGFVITALEQYPGAVSLPSFQTPEKIALLVGREVEGIEPEVIEMCDRVIEIPMLGHKESFNVVQAAAMALYHCRYIS